MYIIDSGCFYKPIFVCKHPVMWIRIVLVVAAFACIASASLAQDKKEKEPIQFHPALEVNYAIGGLINSDNFVFKNGLGLHAIADFEFHEKVYAGIGVGYEQLGEDRLLPIFMDLKAFLKKSKRSAYFTGQLGYALMWNNDLANYNSYTYTGGILFSPGVGYKLPLENAGTVMFNVSYRQQYGGIEYESGGENYTDRLSFTLLAFKIGYLF